MLEVGAGIGQLSSALRTLPGVDRLLAVEPDSRFHAQLIAQVGEDAVLKGTAGAVDTRTPWHAVVSVNVLEHIENDESELALYRRLLEGSRGRLCLFVPARQEIYSRIDRDFGHFRRYTSVQLRQRLHAAGFETLKMRYFNFPGYFAWWLSFKALKGRSFSGPAVWCYDRIIFPPSFWLESRICRPPIGQSLIAVARVRN